MEEKYSWGEKRMCVCKKKMYVCSGEGKNERFVVIILMRIFRKLKKRRSSPRRINRCCSDADDSAKEQSGGYRVYRS